MSEPNYDYIPDWIAYAFAGSAAFLIIGAVTACFCLDCGLLMFGVGAFFMWLTLAAVPDPPAPEREGKER